MSRKKGKRKLYQILSIRALTNLVAARGNKISHRICKNILIFSFRGDIIKRNERKSRRFGGINRFMKHVDIYTDGACRNNPGHGGWGAILVYEGREKELSGGEELTTNNRMELSAVIAALSALKEPCEVKLTTDSQYVVNAIEKGWLESWRNNGLKKSDKGKVLNVDLWEKLIELLDRHSVEFVWVKGHNGHPYNERCDVLATTFADKFDE